HIRLEIEKEKSEVGVQTFIRFVRERKATARINESGLACQTQMDTFGSPVSDEPN
ncbi:hypothetical protein RDWZM_002889, partial [Blomia tropicalis]